MNQPVVIEVVSNDIDADNQIVPSSVSIITNPSNGTVSVNASTGAITYTPNNGWFGNDYFTYAICDGGSPITCDTAIVNVTVNENVGIADLSADNFHVYFSENAIKIEAPNENIEGNFKLFNSAGMLVLDGKLLPAIPFNASSGIYYFEIEGNNGITFHKLLKN